MDQGHGHRANFKWMTLLLFTLRFVVKCKMTRF